MATMERSQRVNIFPIEGVSLTVDSIGTMGDGQPTPRRPLFSMDRIPA